MLDDRAKNSAHDRLGPTRFGPIQWFDELESTNTFLMAAARAGAPEGAVVVADHQTAGRGRLGRTWTAPPGSALLCSILLRPIALQPSRAHLLTAVVALAAAQACSEVAGFVPGIKWPNDLVVDDDDDGGGGRGGSRKLAGILAESDLGPDGLLAVVVGLGLNLEWPPAPPPELAGIAIAADQVAGRPVDRVELLLATLEGVERRYADLCGSGGPEPLVQEYRDRCTTIGRRVRVEMTDREFTGQAVDVSDTGRLGVAEEGGSLRWISVGDVTHLRLQ
jgi:BirA family biotin operon repressor/biotin-[acetyl-CoA-carboxylase] ligase